jgi:hypothetical protein
MRLDGMAKILIYLFFAAALAYADTQKPQSFFGDFVIKVRYNYLLSSPEGYGVDMTRKWPLVIFSTAVASAAMTSKCSKSMVHRS